MAWWWYQSLSKGDGNKALAPGAELTSEQRKTLSRKCKAFTQGLAGCRRANLGDDQKAICSNLESMVVSCQAETVCKPEFEEHRRCYTKVYKTGSYNGKVNCLEQEAAMAACLTPHGLFPV